MHLLRTDRRKTFLLVVAAVAVSIAACEGLVRTFKPQHTYSKLLSMLGSYYSPSDYNTFQLKANYTGIQPSMEHPGLMVRVTTNSERFRGAELDKSKTSVLVLGDSYTFGAYVDDRQTYPAVLGDLISERLPGYQVVNAGYTDGHETDQQYVWLKHNIATIRPKIVILGVFLGNDIQGINPAAWAEIGRDGLPNKWLNKDLYVTEFGWIGSRSEGPSTVGTEPIYKVPVLRESHLCILLGRVVDRLNKMAQGKQVPGYTEEAFQHIFGVYSNKFLEKEVIFLKLVSSMKDVCEKNNAKFMVALLPINFTVEREKMGLVLPWSRFRSAESVYYSRLETLLAGIGVPVLNIEKAMKQSKEGPFFPSNGEVHFNSRGNAFTARQIFEFLTASQYF